MVNVSPEELRRGMSIPSEAPRRFLRFGGSSAGNALRALRAGAADVLHHPLSAGRQFIKQVFTTPTSPSGKPVVAIASPIIGGAPNVVETIAEGAAYSPLKALFRGEIKTAAKQFSGLFGAHLAISEVFTNALHFFRHEPYDFVPSKENLIYSALGGFHPAAAAGAAVYFGAEQGAKAVGKGAIDALDWAQSSGIPAAKEKTTEIYHDVEKIYHEGTSAAGNAITFGLSELPTLPVVVSVGGLGGGGIGTAAEIAAALAALGIGAYAYAHRKKKRKKYKRRKHKK